MRSQHSSAERSSSLQETSSASKSWFLPSIGGGHACCVMQQSCSHLDPMTHPLRHPSPLNTNTLELRSNPFIFITRETYFTLGVINMKWGEGKARSFSRTLSSLWQLFSRSLCAAHIAALLLDSFQLIYIFFFFFNIFFLLPPAHLCLTVSEKLIFSLPCHFKTPTDDSSSPLTSPSALPLPSFSSLWHLFLSLMTQVPSLANFLHEEMRVLRTFGVGWGDREQFCTTCFTCKASGVLQSVIMISRAQSELRG